MAQPKYDSNTGMPIYSVQTDQPAYLCAEFDCTDCTGDMQVVISSMVATDCACEIYGDNSASWKITDITGLNGTHTLTPDATPCYWSLTVTDAVEWNDFFPALDCDPADIVLPAYSASVLMTLWYAGSGVWQLEITSTALAEGTWTIWDGAGNEAACPDGLVIEDGDSTSMCCCAGAASNGTATVTEL